MSSSATESEEELYTVIRWPKGLPLEVEVRVFWANDWTKDAAKAFAWAGCAGLYSCFRVTKYDWAREHHVMQVVTLEYAREVVLKAQVLTAVAPQKDE